MFFSRVVDLATAVANGHDTAEPMSLLGFGAWYLTGRDPERGRQALAWVVDYLLGLTRVTQRLAPEGPRGALKLVTDTPTLFCGLAFQIAATAGAAAGSIARCSVCSKPYTPKRKPARGRWNFCEDHENTGPSLLYKRKARAPDEVNARSEAS